MQSIITVKGLIDGLNKAFEINDVNNIYFCSASLFVTFTVNNLLAVNEDKRQECVDKLIENIRIDIVRGLNSISNNTIN